jgi:Mycolic acid cyclopropane synthetase
LGGLGVYLAKTARADVTGVTLSREQLSISNQRAAREGLQRSVRFELKDYRKIGGCFDRVVSVGMFEHVGVNHYARYFRKIRQLLAGDGVPSRPGEFHPEHRVTGGGHPPPVPTERGVRISRTTLFGSRFTAPRVPASPGTGDAVWVAAAASAV